MRGMTKLAVLIIAACAALASVSPALAVGPKRMKIVVLSNRADLISGGDALVEVVLPADIDATKVRVTLNGGDITSTFAIRPNGRFMGLVEPLEPGDNELVAYVTSAPSPPRPPAHIVITNHAIGGPDWRVIPRSS